MHEKSCSIFVSVSLSAIVIAGTICIGVENVLASEQATLTNSESNSVELRLIGGKMFAQFVDRPLSEVLDAIGRQSSFKYVVSQNLRGHRVSGKFAGASLSDALTKILGPFNYIVVSGATGEVRQLFVISVKSNVTGSIASTLFSQLSVFGGKSKVTENTDGESSELPAEKDFISTEVPEEFDLADQERFFFEASDNKVSVPPEFKDLPRSQTLENLETGPESPTVIIRDLPEFEPISNDTGPIAPGLDTVDLPEFKPYYSENGPTVP